MASKSANVAPYFALKSSQTFTKNEMYCSFEYLPSTKPFPSRGPKIHHIGGQIAAFVLQREDARFLADDHGDCTSTLRHFAVTIISEMFRPDTGHRNASDSKRYALLPAMPAVAP